MTPRDEAPVTVTQADRDFRVKMLGHIIESLDRPCSEGDMIDDRTDALDALIAEFRTQSAAAAKAREEGLRGALERIAERDLLEVAGYHTRKWCVPETGNEYQSRDPIFKRSSYQNAKDFQEIARAALSASDGEVG